MTIAFFSNFFNHHQKMVADEFNRETQGRFTFVESTPIPQKMLDSGYPDYSDVTYLLKVWESDDNYHKALNLAKTADVAIFDGPEALDFEIYRSRNTDKISFDVSERWLKRGILNLSSPRLLRFLWYYYTLFRYKPVYKLCASAFCANDMHVLHAFENRCYKWGYFTSVPELNVDNIISNKFKDPVSVMWCSRFIDWKHPEIPVILAHQLKSKGIFCTFDMYGSGQLSAKIESLINELNVADRVKLRGNVSNAEIHKQMRSADIFLFTSDQNEGWGAVANEAMSNACVVIASDQIGSSPYLIQDGYNGRLFPSNNVDALCRIFEEVIFNPSQARNMAACAYSTIKHEWSAKTAVANLLSLCRSIGESMDQSPKNGPCSKALPIR